MPVTIGELIDRLSAYDRTSHVRLAINPDFPFAHTIGDITASGETGCQVVFIAETGQQEYIAPAVAQALGWQPLTEPPSRTRRGPVRLVEEDH
jgi:hypothetical protein